MAVIAQRIEDLCVRIDQFGTGATSAGAFFAGTTTSWIDQWCGYQLKSRVRRTVLLELLNSDRCNIVISRGEVEGRVVSSTIDLLRSRLTSPERALSFFENVDIAFHGYDDDPRELFEIDEVRNFVIELDRQFPFWLFFLTKRGLGLQCIMLCFMPPYLTDDARKTIFPHKLDELLSKRWFPAMNQICDYVGFSERDNQRLTESVADYFINGPDVPSNSSG